MERVKTFLANAAIHVAVWYSLICKVVYQHQGAANLLLAWSWFMAILAALLFVVGLLGFKDKPRHRVPENVVLKFSGAMWLSYGFFHGEFFFATATACFLAMYAILGSTSDNNSGEKS